MKKFSVIIFIVIILLYNIVLTQDLDEFEQCIGNCNKVIDWFKKNELYDSFVSAFQGGRTNVIRVCKQIFSESTCIKLVEHLISCLK